MPPAGSKRKAKALAPSAAEGCTDGGGAYGGAQERETAGVCCVMPAPGWQKVTCSLPNANLLESGACVVMGRGRG